MYSSSCLCIGQSSKEFSINELLTKRNAQYAIIANVIEKGNKGAHNLLRELNGKSERAR